MFISVSILILGVFCGLTYTILSLKNSDELKDDPDAIGPGGRMLHYLSLMLPPFVFCVILKPMDLFSEFNMYPEQI